MNIKNLLLLLLLLTGFVACSSDKNDNEEIDKENPVLSIRLKAVGGITKAVDAHALPGESNINNYVILIYNNSGELQRNLSGNNASPVVVNDFRVGDALQIVAFVNLSNEAKTSVGNCGTIDKLAEVIEQIGGQNTSNLTMACTAPQSVTLVSGDNNVEISIARLASRIQISSIQTNFKIANDYTVTINNLSLLQVNESSLLYSNGKVEVVSSTQKDVTKTINAPGNGGWELSNSKRLKIVTDGSSPKEGELAMPYAYAFENTNTETPTQLLVNATLRDNNGKEVSTRNFKVTVNATAAANSYIRRNYIYDLGLTFEDTSFDMAALVVKVTIVPWGKVKQEAEVD